MAKWNSRVHGLVEASKTSGWDPTEIIGAYDAQGTATHFSKLPPIPGGIDDSVQGGTPTKIGAPDFVPDTSTHRTIEADATPSHPGIDIHQSGGAKVRQPKPWPK